MMSCLYCGVAFPARGRRRYCSDAHRQAAYRRRSQPPEPQPERRSPTSSTVYECPSCSQRYLGARRCDECNSFCRRIGAGGLCPTCDEPVAFVDLAAG